MAARVERKKELDSKAAEEVRNEAEWRTEPRIRSDASGSEEVDSSLSSRYLYEYK